MVPETPTALPQAIELLGGQTALAAALGVRTGHIFYWLKNRIPAEYCPAIERATGGQVRCEALRPDIDWAVLRDSQPVDVARAGPAFATIRLPCGVAQPAEAGHAG